MNWFIPKISEDKVNNLSRLLGHSKITTKILLNRGCSTLNEAKAFLMPKLDELNPFDFKQMNKAVDRTWEAIKSDQQITIFGDYDADGVCATTILLKMFELLGKKVDYEIPTRSKGYGLTRDEIDKIISKGSTLLITTDCGQTNADEIEYARKAGIDTIILDHHEPAKELPKCAAILNPKIDYKFNGLTSGGISFKFALGVLEKKKELLKENDFIPLSLALSAIAAIADIAPLVNENRVIVHYGLKSLTLTANFGLQALIKKCGLRKSPSTYDMSMRVIPFINAAGRIASAKDAVELFLAKDFTEASQTLKKLEQANNQRRRIEGSALLKARERLVGESVMITWAKDIPVGVIGIIASRLCKELNKPCIVFALEGSTAIGSCRSPSDIDILELLNTFKDLFTSFGGHKVACGIRMPKTNLQKLVEETHQVKLKPRKESLMIDTEVEIKDITDNLAKELELLEPHGPQNRKPLFAMSHVRIHEQSDRIIITKDQLSLNATCDSTINCEDLVDIAFEVKTSNPVTIKLKEFRAI